MTEESSSADRQKELGARLRESREFLGMSQEEVARRLDVPRASVSAIESGKRKVSSLELEDLASLYRTSVDRLLGTRAAPRDEAAERDLQALFRATKDLTADEKESVIKFADFLRSAGRAPEPTGGD